MKLHALLLLSVAVALPGALVRAEPPSGYADPEAWLCHPSKATDSCRQPRTRLSVAADGQRSEQALRVAPDAPIDCFYVYPTISQDPAPHSGLRPGPGELRAVAQQLTPFAAACRLFAPLYRQITLAGLRAFLTGQPVALDPEMAYGDVAAAWKHYLAHDNQGRGVVLIGHSQGTRMLIQLLQREIDGRPEAQRPLVSAVLAGYAVEVPVGQDVGGSFRQLPLCRSAEQVGCVLSWSSFRAGQPPPPGGRFARVATPGMEAACTDPVALSGKPLDAYLTLPRNLLGQPGAQADWEALRASAGAVDFVALPGLLRSRCVNEDGARYLALSLHPGAGDARPRDIPGDLIVNGKPLADWGLHLIDLNAVMGNLVELVSRQGAAWQARPRP